MVLPTAAHVEVLALLKDGFQLRYPAKWNREGKVIVDDLLYEKLIRRKKGARSKRLVLTEAGRKFIDDLEASSTH